MSLKKIATTSRNLTNKPEHSAEMLVMSLFACGAIASTTGFFGFFHPILSIVLVCPLFLLALFFQKALLQLRHLQKLELISLFFLILWWLLHLPQVFVPETGFDAVWYHLPVAQLVIEQQQFSPNLSLYQSFNPLFSDSIFFLGYSVLGELGAKIIAYFFGLVLVVVTYFLSRKLLNRQWSLLICIFVSGFQVVSWQSSSFYIDIAKAVWELSAIWLFINTNSAKSALTLGASLASKTFSILLLPVFVLLQLIQKTPTNKIVMATIISLLVAAPYYWLSYSATGNLFYSLTHHSENLSAIGGAESLTQQIVSRTQKLPKMPIEMVLMKDYASPLLIFLFPLLLWKGKRLIQNRTLFLLTTFTLCQLLLWWYIPPLSVRYALSGFITALLVTTYLLKDFWLKQKYAEQTLILILLVIGIMYMPVRAYVVYRSSQYLLGTQTKQEYLEQFMDGNIDHVLREWHKDVM